MQEGSGNVYAIVLRYPEANTVDLYSIVDFVTDKTKVKLLGFNEEIKVSVGNEERARERES